MSLRFVAVRSGVSLLGAALLLSGCTTAGRGPEQPSSEQSPAGAGASASSTTAVTDAPDPALVQACIAFWGDPDYTDPLSREVLDRAGTAPEAGPSDPGFYAMVGDDIDALFDGAPQAAEQAAETLGDWFRTEPEQGVAADRDAFRRSWEALAGSCEQVSVAASWALAPGEDGTKPAALVCAEVFDTPGTLTPFADANVLTSNMFKLVGLSAREVPVDRMEDVRATSELLTAEIDAVDDDDVRAALEKIRAPFADALDGDTSSAGLQAPLDELSAACTAAGYSSPDLGETENGAVVGASALREEGMDPGEQS